MAFRNLYVRAGMMAAAVAMMTPVAMAQEAAAPQVSAAEIAPVSDAEATQFVEANKKITVVANNLSLELQSASDETAAAAIADKGEKEIVGIIEKEGMTPQRYTEIIQLAETDEATLQKLREKFQN